MLLWSSYLSAESVLITFATAIHGHIVSSSIPSHTWALNVSVHSVQCPVWMGQKSSPCVSFLFHFMRFCHFFLLIFLPHPLWLYRLCKIWIYPLNTSSSPMAANSKWEVICEYHCALSVGIKCYTRVFKWITKLTKRELLNVNIRIFLWKPTTILLFMKIITYHICMLNCMCQGLEIFFPLNYSHSGKISLTSLFSKCEIWIKCFYGD